MKFNWAEFSTYIVRNCEWDCTTDDFDNLSCKADLILMTKMPQMLPTSIVHPKTIFNKIVPPVERKITFINFKTSRRIMSVKISKSTLLWMH